MATEVGELFKDIVSKFQDNVFECMTCHERVQYATKENHVPCFHCNVCEKVNWRVYSINGIQIYK